MHPFHLTLKLKMHREITHTSAGCGATHKGKFKWPPAVEVQPWLSDIKKKSGSALLCSLAAIVTVFNVAKDKK